MFLNKDELFELTGYKRRSAQALELAKRGYEFEQRSDGFILVHREYIAKKFGLTTKKLPKEEVYIANYDALPKPKQGRG